MATRQAGRHQWLHQDRREKIGLFAQHRWTGERISTELGVRHDDNQHFGEHDTWNAALSIPSGDSQQWIVSYATAFRAPTFKRPVRAARLGWQPRPGSRTFPNLRAAMACRHADSQWEASLYRTDVKDLIVWDSSTFQMNNVDEARINGLELAVNTDLMGWASRTSVSFIDPRDRQTGKTLQLRAKRTLTSDLDRQFGDFGVGATWALFSERFADAANSSTLAGYGTLDLRANWQATTSTRLDLKVSNVLDRDYHLAPTSAPPAPGLHRLSTTATRNKAALPC
ncbi:TonB-dependent receptor [Halopseudomonas pachastrellae]|nr:TonB-dependent receptor [Halopseudomonas pachastrellae]